MAVAKRPIPTDAVIPADDIDKNGRLTLKIWPPEHLPESLVVDLDCQPKPKVSSSPVVGNVKDAAANGILDATIKSSFEGSAANHGLPSLSSGTSYGKEPVYENTIEQILGNIERSALGDLKDASHDSFAESKRFAKQLEERIFGIQKQPGSEVAQKMLNGAKKGSSILGIKRLEPMSHVRPMPLCNKDSQHLSQKRQSSISNEFGSNQQPSTTVQTYGRQLAPPMVRPEFEGISIVN